MTSIQALYSAVKFLIGEWPNSTGQLFYILTLRGNFSYIPSQRSILVYSISNPAWWFFQILTLRGSLLTSQFLIKIKIEVLSKKFLFGSDALANLQLPPIPLKRTTQEKR